MPAPPALRPFLRFAKLPGRALAVTRRALEADDEFRSRVAETVDEADVGRAGWLFLSRPEGWEEELATLTAVAEDAAREQAERRAEHDARRRLAAVQEAAERAERVAAGARAEAAEAAAAAAEERRARQLAVEEAAEATRQLEVLTAERDRLRSALATMKAEAERLRRRVAELEAAAAPSPVPVPEPPPPPPPLPPAPPPALDRATLAAPALEEAAEAALRLAETLQAVVASLRPPLELEEVRAERPPARRAPARPLRAAAQRQPAPLPPAVFDDSVQAAEHLVRVNGMVLVVDGYNVSKVGWADLPIAEQRRRLVDALAELAARTGVDTRLVFDGSDVTMPGIVPMTAKTVKVSFSPPGVEADDVVIDLVGQLPPHRPVTVATNDRRVRLGASQAGANLISTEQLLAVLRR